MVPQGRAGLPDNISIHVPLAGHDRPGAGDRPAPRPISIHVPLAGHDRADCGCGLGVDHFNPRAPCGARRQKNTVYLTTGGFQSTCPLRGTTPWRSLPGRRRTIFQSTCPLRGTTVEPDPRSGERIIFQSTCPLRGTTMSESHTRSANQISIHVPLAGHDAAPAPRGATAEISIHVPLAGHDCKKAQRLLCIFVKTG